MTYHLGVFILSSMECWKIATWRLIKEAGKGFEDICEYTWCGSFVCCSNVWTLQFEDGFRHEGWSRSSFALRRDVENKPHSEGI